MKENALKYKDTFQIGRSHGIHAEPITFGLKNALWYEEIKRNIKRWERSLEMISVGQISGAVGTYQNIEAHKYMDVSLRKAMNENLDVYLVIENVLDSEDVVVARAPKDGSRGLKPSTTKLGFSYNF